MVVAGRALFPEATQTWAMASREQHLKCRATIILDMRAVALIKMKLDKMSAHGEIFDGLGKVNSLVSHLGVRQHLCTLRIVARTNW